MDLNGLHQRLLSVDDVNLLEEKRELRIHFCLVF
jgi:hypothetical protein